MTGPRHPSGLVWGLQPLVITPQQPASGTLQRSTAGKQSTELGAWSSHAGAQSTLSTNSSVLFCCSWAALGPDKTRTGEPPNLEGGGERTGVGQCCMPRIQGYHGGMYLYVDLGSLSVGGTSNLGVGRCSLVPSYKVSVWTRPLGEQGITYLMDRLLDFRLTSLSIIVNSRP